MGFQQFVSACGQRCTKTMVYGWFAFISWIFVLCKRPVKLCDWGVFILFSPYESIFTVVDQIPQLWIKVHKCGPKSTNVQ